MDQQALEQLQRQNAMEQAGSFGVGVGIFYLVLLVFFAIVYWRIFTKAGKPGWASLVPIYNIVVFLEIVGRPVWWIVLFFIPLVNFIILIVLLFDFAKSFGKGAGFAVGLVLLSVVFLPILAFGGARYVGPAAKAATPAPAPA